MRQVAARVKHPCFGVRVASVHKINRLHLENVACRGEKLLFEKTVFKTFCGEKDDKYVKTPRKSAVFSVLHLSSTHFGMPDWIRTSGLQSRSLTLYPTELRALISLTILPQQGRIVKRKCGKIAGRGSKGKRKGIRTGAKQGKISYRKISATFSAHFVGIF